MIVVMTATLHVNPVFVRTSLLADVDSFVQDFETDAMPFVEQKLQSDRRPSTSAQLRSSSMGGQEALDLELLHPEQFSVIRWDLQFWLVRAWRCALPSRIMRTLCDVPRLTSQS